MRDIRSDLQERLGAIGERKQALTAEYQTSLQKLEVEEEALASLLEIETARFPEVRHRVRIEPPSPILPLPDFLFEKIKGGHASKEELNRLAETDGYSVEGQSLGRQVHLTLTNMARGGRIKEIGDGRYEAARPSNGFGELAS